MVSVVSTLVGFAAGLLLATFVAYLIVLVFVTPAFAVMPLVGVLFIGVVRVEVVVVVLATVGVSSTGSVFAGLIELARLCSSVKTLFLLVT